MATGTLTDIRTKVRRLTRSLSTNILSDADLDQYINTFVLYDFPEHLRLFNLESTFEFYTQPYQDVYETETTNPTDPLYDFKNRYITVHPPVYIAGYESMFSESREQFFASYPFLSNIASVGTKGDGTTTTFTGTINAMQAATNPVVLLKNNVLFSSIDFDNDGLAMTDYPISNTLGNLRIPDQLPTDLFIQDPNNYINYVTGQFVVTFNFAPGAGQQIVSQTVPMQPSRPLAVLFYDTKFTVRPVPDKVYKVEMNVFKQPSELLNTTQVPELNEWWQLIALGASIKIFQDRMDMESVQMIFPEFNNQLKLANRRTVVQQTSQRTSTIYEGSNNPSGAYGSGFYRGGGMF